MGGSLLSDFHSVKCFIAWKFKLFKSISHSMGKCSKAHPMGENWNIGTHTFSQSMAILFREISTLWYSTSHEKCLGFINGKTQQNPSFNKNLGYRYPYFFQFICPAPPNLHPMLHYIRWMIHVFSPEFPVA